MKKYPKLIGCLKNPVNDKNLKLPVLKNDFETLKKTVTDSYKGAVNLFNISLGVNGEDEIKLALKLINMLLKYKDYKFVPDSLDLNAINSILKSSKNVLMINSYNPSVKDPENMIKLTKKYNKKIIALAMDEKTVSNSASKRCHIAGEIIKKLEFEGIKKEDIIIDAICLPKRYYSDSENTSLKALYMIKEKYEVDTLLGLSNFSYGLDERKKEELSFFLKCISCGLDYAMIESFSKDILDLYI